MCWLHEQFVHIANNNIHNSKYLDDKMHHAKNTTATMLRLFEQLLQM